MILTYAGRRFTAKGTILHQFIGADASGETDPAFDKQPRATRGWPIGTSFEVEVPDPGSFRFGSRIDHPVPREVVDGWVLEDRTAETLHEAARAGAKGKAAEPEAIDRMTIAEVRALMVKSLPARRRALLAVVLARLDVV